MNSDFLEEYGFSLKCITIYIEQYYIYLDRIKGVFYPDESYYSYYLYFKIPEEDSVPEDDIVKLFVMANGYNELCIGSNEDESHYISSKELDNDYIVDYFNSINNLVFRTHKLLQETGKVSDIFYE